MLVKYSIILHAILEAYLYAILPVEKIYGEIGATYVGDAKIYSNGNLDNTPIDFQGFTRLDAAIGYSADPGTLRLL